jgi:predicted AlkP superfamily pyrophosphatase or phosphodiesterase
MEDILRRKKPDLALMHLSAFDSFCHSYGESSPEADEALKVMDAALGRLLDAAKAAGTEPGVILFSDHAQLPVEHTVLPNKLLKEAGLLGRDSYIECCGGSAFFYTGSLDTSQVNTLKAQLEASEGFHRWLTEDEMRESGYASPLLPGNAQRSIEHGVGGGVT